MSRQRHVQSITCISEQGNHIFVFQSYHVTEEYGKYLFLTYLEAPIQVLLTTY